MMLKPRLPGLRLAMCLNINYFLAMSTADKLKLHYCSSLVPDKERQNVGSNLDPNHKF